MSAICRFQVSVDWEDLVKVLTAHVFMIERRKVITKYKVLLYHGTFKLI